MNKISRYTALVDYAQRELASYDPLKPGPSLPKVKAAILSLTLLKQTKIAELIGTKYDVYKAQRYRQDYKDLENFHRRQFAARFVDEMINYTRRNTSAGGIAHSRDLCLFSDVVIFSEDLMDAIFERIESSSEVLKILGESDIFCSAFLNDVFMLIMNIRKGNIAITKEGQFKILNKNIVSDRSPGLTTISLKGRFDENKLGLGLWLANIIRKSWQADSETVQESLKLFLDKMKALL